MEGSSTRAVCTVAGQRLRAWSLSPRPPCARHSGSGEARAVNWEVPGARPHGLGWGARASLCCHEKAGRAEGQLEAPAGAFGGNSVKLHKDLSYTLTAVSQLVPAAGCFTHTLLVKPESKA